MKKREEKHIWNQNDFGSFKLFLHKFLKYNKFFLLDFSFIFVINIFLIRSQSVIFN